MGNFNIAYIYISTIKRINICILQAQSDLFLSAGKICKLVWLCNRNREDYVWNDAPCGNPPDTSRLVVLWQRRLFKAMYSCRPCDPPTSEASCQLNDYGVVPLSTNQTMGFPGQRRSCEFLTFEEFVNQILPLLSMMVCWKHGQRADFPAEPKWSVAKGSTTKL